MVTTPESLDGLTRDDLVYKAKLAEQAERCVYSGLHFRIGKIRTRARWSMARANDSREKRVVARAKTRRGGRHHILLSLHRYEVIPPIVSVFRVVHARDSFAWDG